MNVYCWLLLQPLIVLWLNCVVVPELSSMEGLPAIVIGGGALIAMAGITRGCAAGIEVDARTRRGLTRAVPVGNAALLVCGGTWPAITILIPALGLYSTLIWRLHKSRSK